MRLAVCIFSAALLSAGSLQKEDLQAEFAKLTPGFDGRVGVCAQDKAGVACVNGDQRFSLQSVMKLIVGVAVMDAVDHGRMKLDDKLVIHREDLSLYVQPIEKLVGPKGYTTTIGDLVRRAIVDSDSAAVDILATKLGGPQAVQRFLDRKSVTSLRIDRDEKHLQTEVAGMRWRPEFLDPPSLERAKEALPDAVRTAAYHKYQADVRDTATPKAMAAFLFALAEGKLVSTTSSAHLVQVMTGTVTFPDRLKAGLSGGWTLAHKTGSSGSWKGVTAATNDVGILTAPDGGHVAVVAFIGDSREPSEKKAKLMANAARTVIAQYR